MSRLQATWLPEGALFFWSRDGRVERAIEAEFPEIGELGAADRKRQLTDPGPPVRRRHVRGVPVPIHEVLPALTALGSGARVSDSVRCWAWAAWLGIELAASERVVPSVEGGEARWKALLSRSEDRNRFEAIAESLPPSARCVPTRERGAVRIVASDIAVRAFLDHCVDGVYRQDAWPGSVRGWGLEFAEALRGDESAFTPRDARHQAVPELLAAWSGGAETAGLRLGMTLHEPDDKGVFRLSFQVHPRHGGAPRPISEAWTAGDQLVVDGQTYAHPAHGVLVGLARAARIFPPLDRALRGAEPATIQWNADRAWLFLSEGVEILRDAGFVVNVPAVFAEAGKQRIRARLRIGEPRRVDGRIDLQSVLRFTWEVVLGDLVLDGSDFAELLSRKAPIVQFRGQWVLLDPEELARLPEGLPHEGELPAADALRAVLIGEHEGIPVVADDRLGMVLQALREPPERDVPAGVRGTLRPYQKAGFEWLATLGDLGLGACLADDMGLGKTLQLIVHLLDRKQRHAHPAPSLVICPTSVLGNWGREIRRFAPELKVLRYHGTGRDSEDFEGVDVVLSTYGLLVRDQDLLSEIEWDVVALDEAQYIKNPSARRARAARALQARHRVALSGTPIENKLDELWSIMRFLVPGLLGTRGGFQRTFAVPIERFGDNVAAARLRKGVAPFLLRRVKTDPNVIDDLPEKFEHRLYCSLTTEQAALYEQVVDQHMGRIEGAADIERRGHILAMLTALKQVCNHPEHLLKGDGPLEGRSGKLERVADLVDRIVTEMGERTLLFTQYREMGKLLQRYFEPWWGEIPFLHGGTSTSGRDDMVRSFQNDHDAAPILIVSLRAGGTGLNLTRATHVVHYDRWWNPAVEDQATDRAYRIGQSSDVQVHKLVCQGTLEERIDALLEEKRALADTVVGGERWVTELDDRALRSLVSLGDDAVTEDWE